MNWFKGWLIKTTRSTLWEDVGYLGRTVRTNWMCPNRMVPHGLISCYTHFFINRSLFNFTNIFLCRSRFYSFLFISRIFIDLKYQSVCCWYFSKLVPLSVFCLSANVLNWTTCVQFIVLTINFFFFFFFVYI